MVEKKNAGQKIAAPVRLEKDDKPDTSGIKRMQFGVEGLDEALKGGIPEGDITLLTGTSGTGKTTLAMQFLAYGARHGQKGIYFTLEESANDIIQQFSVFDKGIVDLIATQMLKIVEVPTVDYDSVKAILSSEIDAMEAKRVVIDSITYFQMFFADVMSIRKAVIEVAAMLKARGSVGIFVGEIPYGENKLSAFGVEEFATDGVIALYLLEKQGTFTRALRIVKMRSTKHVMKYSPIDITEKGIVVYPNEKIAPDA